MSEIKVLIVDDEINLSDIIRRSLIKLNEDYLITVANTGNEALDLIENNCFNVMVTDIRMPGISGIDLMKHANEIQEDLQTIIITGHKDYDYAIEALRLGAVNYIKKPIPIEPLHYAIIKAWEKQELKIQLKSSEEKFRSIAYYALDSILLVELDGTVSFWNKAAEKQFGYTPEEAIGRRIQELVIPKQYLSEFNRKFRNYGFPDQDRPESEPTEFMAQNRKGTEFPIEITISPVSINDEVCLVVIIRDITNRKIAEEQLRQSQKIESVGQLAGGVAHDFNNILTGIIGFADLAAELLTEENTAYPYIDAIIKRADDAATLVQQLLAFSRKQILDTRIIDLNKTLSHSSEFMAKILHDDISLRTDLDARLHSINADPTAIQQIITNLCLNSQAAMPEGGEILVKTENVTLDIDFCRSHQGLKPGDNICLTIADTGIGMPDDVKQRIYEPFFTTKETGKGTGLGLSMVYGLVKQHHGYIYCESHVGQGTTFSLYFPRSYEDQVQEDIKIIHQAAAGSETILIVEDDMDVLTILKSILERQGYTTLVAVNGRDAMCIVEKDYGRINLIVSDIVMPEMSGTELFEEVQANYPDIEFLLISGHASTTSEKFTISDNMAFLQKPFTAKQLNKKVRKLLDAKKT